MIQFRMMQGNDRLTQCRCKTRIKRGVPLSMFIIKLRPILNTLLDGPGQFLDFTVSPSSRLGFGILRRSTAYVHVGVRENDKEYHETNVSNLFLKSSGAINAYAFPILVFSSKPNSSNFIKSVLAV